MQSLQRRPVLLSFSTACLVLAASCQHSFDPVHGPATPGADAGTAEEVIGERLFLETRFAQYFAARAGADVNAPLAIGDPTLDVTVTTDAKLPGPFAGRSMNCAACHLVDQQDGVEHGGLRTYADFARRSPIPERRDGRNRAPRNAPSLVDSIVGGGAPVILHLDGEFASGVDLVVGTLTGRNYGWLPDERAAAIAHVARIVREDDGTDELAADTAGLSYAALLAPGVAQPEGLNLPESDRIDVGSATDRQLVMTVARLVDAYVRGLRFQRDELGRFSGSPYDAFLRKNALPLEPDAGESDLQYSRRLRAAIEALTSPEFVDASDGEFAHHAQAFQFGAEELQGLRTFLSEPDAPFAGNVAMCVACHPAPRFSDGKFHNVGVAQREFDALHGAGAFGMLFVPDLRVRSVFADEYLPPSAAHPNALGPFLSIPSLDDPSRTDLGLWNVFANPDVPAPQNALRSLLVEQLDLPGASDGELLPATIALFKTLRLRDLADSGPYMHSGAFDSLDDLVVHYRGFSKLARGGQVRNAAPELAQMDFVGGASLVAFLRSLTEDYD